MVFLTYLVMSIYDAAVLFGTGYLIVKHDWSSLWLLFSVFIIMPGSSPRGILKIYYNKVNEINETIGSQSDAKAPHASHSEDPNK